MEQRLPDDTGWPDTKKPTQIAPAFLLVPKDRYLRFAFFAAFFFVAFFAAFFFAAMRKSPGLWFRRSNPPVVWSAATE